MFSLEPLQNGLAEWSNQWLFSLTLKQKRVCKFKCHTFFFIVLVHPIHNWKWGHQLHLIMCNTNLKMCTSVINCKTDKHLWIWAGLIDKLRVYSHAGSFVRLYLSTVGFELNANVSLLTYVTMSTLTWWWKV